MSYRYGLTDQELCGLIDSACYRKINKDDLRLIVMQKSLMAKLQIFRTLELAKLESEGWKCDEQGNTYKWVQTESMSSSKTKLMPVTNPSSDASPADEAEEDAKNHPAKKKPIARRFFDSFRKSKK